MMITSIEIDKLKKIDSIDELEKQRHFYHNESMHYQLMRDRESYNASHEIIRFIKKRMKEIENEAFSKSCDKLTEITEKYRGLEYGSKEKYECYQLLCKARSYHQNRLFDKVIEL